MAAILGKIWLGYQFVFEELPDPRTKDWLFVAKPYQLLSLLVLYLYFVLKWGPKWMKNRQPFNLDIMLIVYNAFQVVICALIFNKAIYLAWGWDYKWICEPVDFSNSTRAIDIARCTYYYLLIKIIDLLDTVFFVLRKKFNQVSFLHIYHHSGMVLLIWAAATYLPGGHATLVGVINSFVHVFMYSYYLLSVIIPSVKNALWIKKHVTQLQIIQFFWCVLHMAALVFKTDCEYPRWVSAVFLPQNLFMLVLFIDFYIKTYIKKPRELMRAQNNKIENRNLNKSHQNNNSDKNDIGKMKLENVVTKLNKGISDEKDPPIRYSSQLMNGHGKDVSSEDEDNETCQKLNNLSNGKHKSNTTSGKCKKN